MKVTIAVIVLAMTAAACSARSEAAVPPSECAVTVPGPGFVPPPGAHPSGPPERYDAAWYGTARLWTMLGMGGERWDALPEHDGKLSQKLFYWSEGFRPAEEPMPALSVSARRIDGPGTATAAGPATNGATGDLGSFIVTGIELPSAGCWELTATYRGFDLTYVVEVEPGS